MSLGYKLAELLEAVPSGGDEYLARCPICGDSKRDHTKRRFQINVVKNEYVCFNGGCNAKGRAEQIKDLILNLDGTIDLKDLFTKKVTTRKTRREEKDAKPPISEEAKKILFRAMPLSQCPPQEQKQCVIDLLPRKVFTYEDLWQLFLVPPSTHPGWDWRVIIPITAESFQGKSMYGAEPKYLSPPGIQVLHRNRLPNEDNWDPKKPVLMTEGALDFHSLPRDNTGCLLGVGKFHNSDILRKLLEYKEVVFVPDSDLAGFVALTKLWEERHRIKNMRIVFPHWIRKDLGDVNDVFRFLGLTKSQTREALLDYAKSLHAAQIDILANKIERNPNYYRKDKKGATKWRMKTIKVVRN